MATVQQNMLVACVSCWNKNAALGTTVKIPVCKLCDSDKYEENLSVWSGSGVDQWHIEGKWRE